VQALHDHFITAAMVLVKENLSFNINVLDVPATDDSPDVAVEGFKSKRFVLPVPIESIFGETGILKFFGIKHWAHFSLYERGFL
jgi:hypothetical protein